MTSYAISTEQEWPYVTINHFETRGEKFRDLSHTHLVTLAPAVTDLEKWANYSEANQWWIQQSYDSRGESDLTAERINPNIHYKDEDGDDNLEEGRVEYLPVSQESRAPYDVSTINNDLDSHHEFAKIYRFSKQAKVAVLSEVFDPSLLLGEEAVFQTDDGTFHPESVLVQPVWDTFDETTRKAVAAAVAVIPWDTFFEGLLHEGADGLICVIKDTCGDAFTYRIDGPHATFLGFGDKHESKFDGMEFETPFAPFINFDVRR